MENGGITKMKEQIKSQEIMNNYYKDRRDLRKTIDDFGHIILPLYKKEYPFRYLSYYRMKKFDKSMRRLCLVPDVDEFKKISTNNELYDADVFFMFYTKEQPVAIKIPFVINVTKLNEYLITSKASLCKFKTDQLKQIIYPECFDSYKTDMAIKKAGGDLLEDVKAKNQVIVMKQGKASDTFLINGTHRTIGAINTGVEEIEGYCVSPELCSRFALTSDFEILYEKLFSLYRKVHIGQEQRNK